MKYFKVIQTVYREYKIPAEDEDQARQIFLDDDIDLSDYFVNEQTEGELEIEEIGGKDGPDDSL